jgi:predicted RNA binding protein YcfA (HicA-like mRNA interferase family)
VDEFPSMRWPKLRRILQRAPLNYEITRQKGSHKKLEAEGRPILRLSFHDKQELPGSLIRTILVEQVGLTEDEARALV